MSNLDFSNNTELLKRDRIGETPFWKITTDEGIFIALGQKAVTGKLTEAEAEEKESELKMFDWKLMLGVLRIMVEETTAQMHLDIMKWNDAKEGGTNHE